jgi:hypothetical protein
MTEISAARFFVSTAFSIFAMYNGAPANSIPAFKEDFLYKSIAVLFINKVGEDPAKVKHCMGVLSFPDMPMRRP